MPAMIKTAKLPVTLRVTFELNAIKDFLTICLMVFAPKT